MIHLQVRFQHVYDEELCDEKEATYFWTKMFYETRKKILITFVAQGWTFVLLLIGFSFSYYSYDMLVYSTNSYSIVILSC